MTKHPHPKIAQDHLDGACTFGAGPQSPYLFRKCRDLRWRTPTRIRPLKGLLRAPRPLALSAEPSPQLGRAGSALGWRRSVRARHPRPRGAALRLPASLGRGGASASSSHFSITWKTRGSPRRASLPAASPAMFSSVSASARNSASRIAGASTSRWTPIPNTAQSRMNGSEAAAAGFVRATARPSLSFLHQGREEPPVFMSQYAEDVQAAALGRGRRLIAPPKASATASSVGISSSIASIAAQYGSESTSSADLASSSCAR